MNTINAEQRLRVAAADKAEAAKIKVGCFSCHHTQPEVTQCRNVTGR